ncbi:response regulator transcription factor [Gloeothece verrucosa]|uniref:Transcriptional regulator, LuxR family n=1 Tax=Gloeothece verrucosa (strain PCC 7822) TaxID=497965 RepID=E0UNE5_GLOV7|nr:LuxR C-terminal-related transcriptional regulator [Gloeothece verrucosa]ADN18475.1 transcriptional regulator, LuxR family [Gloeothece verrucosa PCC 7822]
MDENLFRGLNTPIYKENWNLMVFSEDTSFLKSIYRDLKANRKFQIIGSFSIFKELETMLEQVEPDFLLIWHRDQVEIANDLKRRYPTLFIILWNCLSGGDASCFSTAPLAEQLDRIVPLKTFGTVMFNIQCEKIYYELVKKTTVTPQEKKMLQFLSYGFNYNEIASRLDLTHSTLKTYMKDLREKLNARDKTHLLAIAFRTGLVS